MEFALISLPFIDHPTPGSADSRFRRTRETSRHLYYLYCTIQLLRCGDPGKSFPFVASRALVLWLAMMDLGLDRSGSNTKRSSASWSLVVDDRVRQRRAH